MKKQKTNTKYEELLSEVDSAVDMIIAGAFFRGAEPEDVLRILTHNAESLTCAIVDWEVKEMNQHGSTKRLSRKTKSKKARK